MKLSVFRLLLIAAILPGSAGMAQTLPSPAQKTIDDYEQYKAALMKEAEAKIAARRNVLVRELEARVATETRAGNLASAMAINAKITELKGGAPAPATTTASTGAEPARTAQPRGRTGKIDFEAKLAGWRTLSATATPVADAAHSGRYGLKIEDPTGKTDMFGEVYFLSPNKTYSAQFWARVKSGRITVGINCYDATGKFIGNAGSVTAAEGDAAEWKSIAFPVQPPPGTNRGSFWIKAGGNAVVADLDDFTLDPAP